jgi:hypothetical protein
MRSACTDCTLLSAHNAQSAQESTGTRSTTRSTARRWKDQEAVTVSDGHDRQRKVMTLTTLPQSSDTTSDEALPAILEIPRCRSLKFPT